MAPKTNTSLLYIFFSFCCIHISLAQPNTIHSKINTDIYRNFSKAYQTLDYELFAAIHSKKMIRISGNSGTIKNTTNYLKEYKKRWSDPKRKATTINFRLFERILSDSLVSDRGIYKVSYKDNDKQTKHSYGQFHVLLLLENEIWKIQMDYDSNEKNTVNQKSYNTAFALSEYKKYLKKQRKLANELD